MAMFEAKALIQSIRHPPVVGTTSMSYHGPIAMSECRYRDGFILTYYNFWLVAVELY